MLGYPGIKRVYAGVPGYPTLVALVYPETRLGYVGSTQVSSLVTLGWPGNKLGYADVPGERTWLRWGTRVPNQVILGYNGDKPGGMSVVPGYIRVTSRV